MTVYTPYGYGEVDMLKLQEELEANAKRSSEAHKVILEYIAEQELQVRLAVEQKDHANKEAKKE